MRETPRKIWSALREPQTPALTVPHHGARELAADLTCTDEELEPAFEIFSGWGKEQYCGPSLQDTNRCFTRDCAVDALQRGYRMGFVGGGDGQPRTPGRQRHRGHLRS